MRDRHRPQPSAAGARYRPRMALVSFALDVDCPASAERTWQALIDWRGHATWIPRTTVRILQGDGGVGTSFVARSGIGPLAFDDTMDVTLLDGATRTAAVRKTGPLLTGTAGFTVSERGAASRIHWHEDVHVPGVPSLLAPALAVGGRVMFRIAIRRLARRLLATPDPTAR